MQLRSFRNSIALLAVSSLFLVPLDASAAPKDKEALKLHDQAMNEDYLSVEFDKAEDKLGQAIELCGGDACSGEVLGKIFIARATVKGVGRQDIDAAREDLQKALAADPKAKLLEGLTTPELEEAFAEAKGAGGVVEPDEEEPDAGPIAGDFEHTPPDEQEIHTPVPIYAEVPDEFGATKVILRYKPFGGVKWSTVELGNVGDGFGGEIPCRDVTTTGEVRYYLIAADADDTPLAVAGSAKNPFTVKIVNKLTGEPPALPGKSAPTRCAAKEDCPPGLPGCPDASGRGDKGWGASCEESQECQAGYICAEGFCEEGEEEGGGDGKKSDKLGLLISLTGQLDMAFIGGQENVCSPESNDSYACFVTDGGEQFYGNPADVQGSNGISGGLGIGGARLMIGADYMLLRDVGLGLGARVGFAFGGSPSSETDPPEGSGHSQAKSFLPLHAEGRASFYFPNGGHFEASKIKGHAFLGGGVAQVNASVPVKVCDLAKTEGEVGGCAEGRLENVDAYQITGLNFIGFGAGASYMITDLIGVTGEAKFMIMLPTSGFVIAPTIGPFLSF